MEHIERNIKLIIILSLSIIFIVYFIFFTSNGDDEKNKQIDIEENIAEIVHPDQEKIILIAKSLGKGVNTYNEAQASQKAISLLDSLQDSFYSLYYKGYANEIIGNYSKAIEFYLKAMDTKDMGKREKALSLNQIGHVYDALGDVEKANNYYSQSENIGENLLGNLINRGRNEFRNKNFPEAEKYFKLALRLTQDRFLKSELYYNLSLISLSSDKSIGEAYKTANLGIDTQKDYPYNYISLGIYYILKGGEDIEKAKLYLEKAISINSDISLTYRYLGVYYYLKGDTKKSKQNFETQLSMLPHDFSITKEDRDILKKDAEYNLLILSKKSKGLNSENLEKQQELDKINEQDIILTSAPEKEKEQEIENINPKLFVIGLGNQDVGYIELVSSSRTTTSKGSVCSNYVTKREPIWGNCNLTGDWSKDGKIQCKQDIIDWDFESKECGKDVVKTTKTCFTEQDCVVLSTSSCDRSTCFEDTPKTQETSQLIDIFLDLENSESTCDNIYANDEEKCGIKISTKPIITNQNKTVEGFSGMLLSNIKDLSMIPSDRIGLGFNEKTNNALDFSEVKGKLLTLSGVTSGTGVGVGTGTISGTGTIFSFIIDNIKAVSPFKTGSGKISFEIQSNNKSLLRNTGATLEFKNISYNFLKPYYGELQIKDGNLKLASQNTLVLDIIKHQNSCNLCSSYQIENFSTSMSTTNPGFVINNLIGLRNISQNPEVDFTMVYSKAGLAEANNIKTTPYIKYKLAGRDVRYILGKTNVSEDTSGIKLNNEYYKGLKTIGTQNLDGKYMIFGKTNSATYQLKTKIKENAIKQISMMKSGDVINGVKYVEGDYEVNSNQNYETLIVKDGNVIISKDLTSTLGIIVLKDNYNVNYDYQNKGNVYVTANVGYIDAIIYADGGIISVDNSKKPINDSSSRTLVLSKQLVLKGCLLTSNTIGGAENSNGEYYLPGLYKTQDYNKAIIYDLNYIRRGSTGNNVYNMGIKDPFLIIYDSKIRENPPKGFEE